jgi:hypothetical protein
MLVRYGAALLGLIASAAHAGTTNSIAFIPVQAPTLDEFGLVAVTLVVGIAGALAARRRRKK